MRAIRKRVAESEAAAIEVVEAKPKKQRKAKAPRARRASIASHPVFMPMMLCWGAVLGAMAVFVLPPAIIDTISAALNLAALGPRATFVIAAIAALLASAVSVSIGLAIRKLRGAAPKAGVEAIETIDPAAELGSESLDAPLEPANEDELELVEVAPEQPVADAPAPREMDLAEFGALPGRNAVWVEEDVAPAEPVAAKPPQLSAIETLRRVPPQELSLVQMVERFAAALHERQEADRRLPAARQVKGRDAALAEALRALTVLSSEGFTAGSALDASIGDTEALAETTRELHSALAKLHRLRGAA